MSTYVPIVLRRFVMARAGGVCEYCLIHEDDTFFGCQIEHIIAEKHGGRTSEENLASACSFCNCHKGIDVASLLQPTGRLVRLFHPRTDRWAIHFRIGPDGITILPVTEVGIVTINLLGMNHPDRLLERRSLVRVERYLTLAARNLIEDRVN